MEVPLSQQFHSESGLITLYLRVLEDRGRASATRRAVESDLTHFAQWWEKQRDRTFSPEHVLPRDIQHWRLTRQQHDGVTPNTINRGLSSLRKFYQWAQQQGLVTENPMEDIPEVPSVPLAPRSLPNEAIDALLRTVYTTRNAVLRRRDEAILALLVYAGLRAQEACDLQLRDLDLNTGMIIVRSGKAGKARRVPLHPDAQALINSYVRMVRCPTGMPPIGSAEEREPFLVGLRVTHVGSPAQPGIKTRLIWERIHGLGTRAAAQLQAAAHQETNPERIAWLLRTAQVLEHISPHMLRHSLARRMLKQGAQLTEVQRILGHSRLATTSRYLTPTEEDMREAINRAGI